MEKPTWKNTLVDHTEQMNYIDLGVLAKQLGYIYFVHKNKYSGQMEVNTHEGHWLHGTDFRFEDIV